MFARIPAKQHIHLNKRKTTWVKKTKNDEGTFLRPAQLYIKYLEIRSEVCSCCNCITLTMRHNMTACLEVFGNMHQLLRK